MLAKAGLKVVRTHGAAMVHLGVKTNGNGNPGKALFYLQENGCPINFHVNESNEISRSMADLRLNHVESYPDGLQTVALKDDFLFYMNVRIS